MGFHSVFHSLQELFPQVDVRVLKAVAIEHSKDVNEAVESVLFEVLPHISSPQVVLLTSGGKHRVDQEETFLLRHREAVEDANAGLPSESRFIARDVAFGTDHTNDTLSVKSTCSDEAVAGSLVSSACGVNDSEESFVDNDEEEVMSSAKDQEVNLLDGSNYGSIAIPSLLTHEVALVSDHCSDALHSDIQDLNGEIAYDSLSSIRREYNQDRQCSDISSKGDKSDIAYDFLSSICRENHQDRPCSDTSSPKGDKLPVHKEKLDSVECGAMPDKGVNNVVSEREEPGSSESNVEPLVFETFVGYTVDKSCPTTIDVLEEFISEAKNNKNALLLAKESILNKVREVELQEKAAEQVKEEASRSGLDILTEVDNLKQMVHQAKETYDMHAGEVYGEKSILASEARELKSRLLNLSNEKDTSLSIIDEMQWTLQERLVAAEAEKVAVEKEKLEKEESARKALDEQVLIMDKVVKESKKLQQEAEENAKLREFLMDRGRVVDILQGEIAVICEDVKLLKERIDGRLPISRSLSSSQTSTSSSLSVKRISPDRIIKKAESSDSLNMPSQEQLSEGDQSRDMKSSQSQKTSLDDEWVLFFKDDAELCS